MTPEEERLLGALAGMCVQYLEEDGVIDNMCMGAGEEAMAALQHYGLIEAGFRCGTWTEAGKKFLATH